MCREDCEYKTWAEYDWNAKHRGISCLYRLRLDRTPVDYVNGIWTENIMAFRNPLTPHVNRIVCDFMKSLTVEIGKRYHRFQGKLHHVGSSLEETKTENPDEFDFNIALVTFSRMCVPVPTAEAGVFNLKLKAISNMYSLPG